MSFTIFQFIITDIIKPIIYYLLLHQQFLLTLPIIVVAIGYEYINRLLIITLKKEILLINEKVFKIY